jgi:protein ImuA
MFLFCSHSHSTMQTQNRQQRLAALRDTIANIERKPALAEMRSRAFDGAADGFPRLPGGLLQDVCTDAVRNGGASLGFALGQVRTLFTPKRLAVLYLQLAADAQFFGLPYGPGLSSFGLDPAQLVIVRASDMQDLLWVAEEALACQAVAGIVADIGGAPEMLDFTASRRLSLRTAESGTSLFLLRYGADRPASAAHLRWHLAPHRSGRKPFDDRAPGSARWGLTLEKGLSFIAHPRFVLEWTANGFATLPAELGIEQDARTTLPIAVPARLAGRLSQAG